MLEKKLEKIRLSESESLYHVEMEYKKTSQESNRDYLAIPKRNTDLKSFIFGLIFAYNAFIDVSIENLKEKAGHKKPLKEEEFKDLKEYIHAWTFSGLAPD